MAGRGPAPKDRATRRRRNADPVPTTVVEPDDELRGPELPDGVAWHSRTIVWWDVWRRSPQAKTFTATDWDFLVDTALLHSGFWETGNPKIGSELRLRVAKFGATPEDRARLRLQIDDPDGAAASKSQGGESSGGRYAHLRVVPD